MRPFALLHRDGADHVDVLEGDIVTVDALADIPLTPGKPGPQTLALIPFRQIAERGFDCVDDGTPLECLRIAAHTTRPLREIIDGLPAAPVALAGGSFDITDDAYGEIVAEVLRDEIGHGEGANFVIHRVFTATVGGDPLDAARAAFRNLLTGERGAYWTFLVHTGTRTLVGATPERHVSVADGLTMMNPISGTFRHDGTRDLLDFLADPKETDELYMVLDEELKMMAAVAEHGGQVVGPYLKRMAHLTHTEYLLAGKGSLDVREVLRATMFAPTVTGSPLENACRVIARHERRGRGYYAGVLALLGHDDEGRQTLDAPILIRTAEISPAGALRVPVGATLVRHSTAAGEVAETHTKAAGVLAALGAAPPPGPAASRPDDGPEVLAALAARNDGLARFWLDQRRPGALTVPGLDGRTAVIVDNEDTFTAMLAHQLRALGLTVTVVPWTVAVVPAADLVVVGPGPGDPASDDPKMLMLRGLVADLLTADRPLLAVCLGHQILCATLGLRLHRRDQPYQGVARDIDLFGTVRRVGFYSSFTALADPVDGVEIAADPADGTVHALRGPGFAGVQFHPESVLSADGVALLAELLPPLLSRTVSPAVNG
ncbi:anthranilate synthase family protein [Amorphoplanes digitatis]|uniref:anthranilate synthase n=1 Tax=Actinoplanes digitatis TaxID=1868 RepID=A0A7W7I2G1_9ACTN|nr:anthranilate synthase family protein [Actinoplanes digitatis]MBB4765207.1 phenazine biosynthesis protein phzE [Actinoplanes digitatis]BFE74960.1 phenazine biosynthesis protein PhzE [Actinoplanes digitatis]GID94658.1 phenazine-specific anthranilate synthase component I [Actinoplanes digitatis]